MSIQAGRLTATHRSPWSRHRVQLGIATVIAVVLPWLIQAALSSGRDYYTLTTSAVGASAALVIGYYGFRRTSHHPGVRSTHHIIPSVATGYLAIVLIFFLFRFDYSRLYLSASFVLAVVFHYAIYMKLRGQAIRIGHLPFANVPSEVKLANLTWITIRSPSEVVKLDAIAVDLTTDIPDEWERFLTDRALEGTLVIQMKQVVESVTGRVTIDHLSENTMGSLIPGIGYQKAKRAADLVVAVMLLPLVLPLLVLVAIIIRLDSSGSPLFRQQRMGFRGQPFKIYKLRTMTQRIVPVEDARADAMTQADDARVTRVGRFLRQSRIDELPQIVNIIKGEMSWIGPRPEAVPLSLWYEKELPFYRYRHIVRPGITGWAQVNQGHVAEVDEVLWKLHYDFYYIKNFSFWLDAYIVVQTVRTMLSGFGAR